MATVTALEAKTRFGTLLKRVARGEEVVITRHDRPVARLVPEGQRRLSQVQQAITDLRNIRRGIAVRTGRKATLSDGEVRAAIDAGRL